MATFNGHAKRCEYAVGSSVDGPGFESHELVLPSSLFSRSIGVSFDLGGSRFKVAFRKKTDATNNNQTDTTTIVLAAFPRGRLEDAVAFAKKYSAATNVISSVDSSTCSAASPDRPTPAGLPTLRASGMSLGRQQISLIERTFNAKLVVVDEFKLMLNALQLLLQIESTPSSSSTSASSSSSSHDEHESVFYGPAPDWVYAKINNMVGKLQALADTIRMKKMKEKDAAKNDVVDDGADGGKNEATLSTLEAAADVTVDENGISDGEQNGNRDAARSSAAAAAAENVEKKTDMEYPYAVLIAGSGTSFTLVNEDGTYSLVSGTADGGLSVMSLCKLLCGTDNYEEFMSLASRGDETKVSSVQADSLAKPDETSFYTAIPDDIVLYNFGKVFDKEFTGYAREDMARALLVHVITNIVSFASWVMMARKCRSVYVCGGLFEHQFARDLFSYFFISNSMFINLVGAKFKFIKLGSFLSVLGGVINE